MTLRRRRTAALVALAQLVACFKDAPSIGTSDATQSDSGSSDGSTDGPSTSNDPTITTQADDSSDTSTASTDDGPSCSDPPCVEPGTALWTTILGEAGSDGAYSVLVQDDAVFAFGERAQGGGTDPWMGRLAIADGSVEWESTSPSNEGITVLRGATIINGTLVAVGATEAGGIYNGFFQAGSTTGSALFDVALGELGTAFLLDVIPSVDGAIAVGWFDAGVGLEPWLVELVGDEGQWTLQRDSHDEGTFLDMQGALFSVVARGDGSMVAVGFETNAASNDAVVMLLSPAGGPVGTPLVVGGAADDDFTQIGLVDDNTAIAVGRQSTEGNDSQIAIATVGLTGEGPSMVEMRLWTDGASMVANGMANDGDTVFIAAGLSDNPDLPAEAFESRVMRFDAGQDTPTWVAPFEVDSPGRDYAADVAIVDDETIVVCGVATTGDDAGGNLWVRRIQR